MLTAAGAEMSLDVALTSGVLAALCDLLGVDGKKQGRSAWHQGPALCFSEHAEHRLRTLPHMLAITTEL